MKYLHLLVILVLITSCKSTKQAIEKPVTIPDTEIVETQEVVKDSIVESKNEVKAETAETTNTSETIETANNEVIEIKNTPITFNHNNWNSLLQKHVSKKGNVNYKGFKADRKALLSYLSSLSENTPTEAWTKDAKLAYWINAYNAMTIDLILRHYPIQSIKDIKDPWDQRYWKIGDKWINLNEIEHDILRKMNEPRIHFGIVCASFSCPKLLNEAFVVEKIETQLTKATKEFLSDPNRNEISQNNLKLSKIFQWFSKDFKQDGDLIDFLNKYSDITISEKAKKSFKDYNWDLNE